MTEIDCGTLTDRMPDVAAGSATWSAEQAAHLASCDACGPEWKIVQAARRLGSSAAGRIDAEKLAANVLAGVKGSEKRSRTVRIRWFSVLAAAALVVVMVRIYQPPSRRAAEPPVAAARTTGALPLAELDPLDEAQLQAVLEQLEAPTGSLEGSVEPRMHELDDQQLERVLRSMEG